MTLLFASAALGGLRLDLPPNVSATDITGTPTNAQATVTFKRDGTIVDQDAVSLGAWISPRHSTVGDGYKVKFARSSGDAFSAEASADSVYTTDISADRSYTQTQTVLGIRQCTGTWTVANAAETVIDTATGTVYAEEG